MARHSASSISKNRRALDLPFCRFGIYSSNDAYTGRSAAVGPVTTLRTPDVEVSFRPAKLISFGTEGDNPLSLLLRPGSNMEWMDDSSVSPRCGFTDHRLDQRSRVRYRVAGGLGVLSAG
jgi:hypothetical protein